MSTCEGPGLGGGAGNTVNNAQAQNFALVGLPAVEESVAKVENAPREGGCRLVRDGFNKKVTREQKPEGGEAGGHAEA